MTQIDYWRNFYTNNEHFDCSDFCVFVMNYFVNITDILYVLDSGCGNGRDSYSLCEKYKVVGVDSSGFIPESKENVNFISDDFTKIDKSNYDLIYSRFTFHSINNEQHQQFLDTIKVNTYLAIEARSIKGIDDEVHYGKTHYRNYIDLEYLKNILLINNFDILFIDEGIDMAKYKAENPICIRVICKKSVEK